MAEQIASCGIAYLAHLTSGTAQHIRMSTLETTTASTSNALPLRAARLARLAEICSAQRYLEIGVFKGETLFGVPVPFKIAVDPEFRLDTSAPREESPIFHEATSDDFFRTAEYPAFDLIYLDGLHTYEQTTRDFLSSLAFAHGSTVWLIDDTVPNDAFSTLQDQQRCYRIRRTLGNSDTSWMGDTFKTVYFIHDMLPQFSLATFRGHGQTVVWRERRKDFAPFVNNMRTIAELDFPSFKESKNTVMNFLTDDAIYESVSRAIARNRAALDPSLRHADQ